MKHNGFNYYFHHLQWRSKSFAATPSVLYLAQEHMFLNIHWRNH